MTNLKKLPKVKMKSPAQFMAWWQQHLDALSPRPRGAEGRLILNMHFISSRALTLEKKLQKVEFQPSQAPKTALVNLTFKVYDNREELQLLASAVKA